MILYLLRNLVNDKCYVGITTGTLEERWRLHLNRLKYGRKHGKDYMLYQAMRKYGPENFSMSVLAEVESFAMLCLLEECAIIAHDTFFAEGRGYNMTLGGEGTHGWKHTLEARAKMSSKIKAARAREGNHWEGRHHSDEARAKMSAAKKGKPSPLKGRKTGPLPLAVRQKMSETRRGRVAWNDGKKMPWSEERPNPTAKPIELLGKRYASIIDCSRQTGIPRQTLREYLRNGKACYIKE